MTGDRPDKRRADARASIERDVDDELGFHHDRVIAEMMARGATRGEAEIEARRRFGPVERHRARLVRLDERMAFRERRRATMQVLASGLREAMRGVRRSPAFTAAVAAILTLGLGVNALTYGIVDRLVLRGPADIQHPERLRRVLVEREDPAAAGTITTDLAYPDYRDLLAASQLDGAAAETGTPLLVGSGSMAQRAEVLIVTASYFPMLGVTPALGRFFTDKEGVSGGPRLAVISHALWQGRFHGDPSVLGRVLAIGDHRYEVIGVAPERFTGAAVQRVDVFLPLEAAADEQVFGAWQTSRHIRWLAAIVRLHPGTPDAAAEAELTAMYRREHPDTPARRVALAPLTTVHGPTASAETSIAGLVGAVALVVLLIACANAANLFLARALRRQDQIAVRLALGGGRRRLIAEQAIEGAAVALVGAAAAIGAAMLGASAVERGLFPEITWIGAGLDLRLLVILPILAALGGALAAALPMWQAGRLDLLSWVCAGSLRHTRTRTRLQAVMLAGQTALSMLLLVGAGLFVRSLIHATSAHLGIQSDRVLVVGTVQGDAPLKPAFLTTLRGAVERIPGVDATTLVGGTIPFVSSWAVHVVAPGVPNPPTLEDGGPYAAVVEPGYFDAVGTTVLEGRPFTPADRAGTPLVAIVNRTMARLYWPGQTAIGKCLKVGKDATACATIVGVAENVRRQAIDEGASLLYYIPSEQAPPDLREGSRLLVRVASGDFDTLARISEAIRRQAWTLAPSLRYVSARPLDAVIAPQRRAWVLGAQLFGVFALLALAVAAVGIYSVMMFDVEARRREIGIRSALGATAGSIVGHVVRSGVALAAVGVFGGLVLAYWLTPLTSGLLYGVRPLDPMVLASAAAVLLLAAASASAIPAVAASHVDPSDALRDR